MFQRLLSFQYSSGIVLEIVKPRAIRACLICVGIKTTIQIIPEAIKRQRPQVSHWISQPDEKIKISVAVNVYLGGFLTTPAKPQMQLLV